jgi:hypothetical protein
MRAATEQEPTIEERQTALDAEKKVVIDAYIDERAAQVPGVPRDSVANSYLARAHGCVCQEYKIVRKLETDAEELARKQQAEHALPAG